MKAWIILLLLVSTVNAQVIDSQIKEQTTHYGECLMQLCIEHNITSAYDYYMGRSDCSGKVTVRDTSGRIIIQNKDMLYLYDGAYGYPITPVEFKVNVQYRAVVNFTIPGGQSASVSSMFMVLNDTTEQSASSAASGSLISGLSNMLNVDFSGMASSLIGGFRDAIISLLNIPILKTLYNIGIGAVDLVLKLWNFISTMFYILGSLILNPSDTIANVIIPGFINIMIGIGLIYLLWCLLFEAVLIGYAFIHNPNGDVFAVVQEWFMLHFKVIQVLFMAIYRMTIIGVQLVMTALKGVSVVRQIFQI